MEVTSYKTGELPSGTLEELTGRIYAGRQEYAASLAAELRHQLGPANPFLASGSRENFIVLENGLPAAHACAVVDGRLPGGTGLIGYFEAVDPGAARLGLVAACGALRARGVKTVYGPVNDTVWQRYGVAASGEAPPYQGEPFTPAAYAGYFSEAGFDVADRRITTALPADEAAFGSYAESRDKLAARGFAFTEPGPQDLAGHAARIHAVASAAFSASPLFVPAGLDEFVYSARGRAAGSVLFLARDAQGKPAAFLWGLPDGFSGGENFIFKTIAVLPEYRGIGLGRALFFLMHARAKELGARRFLFSTMRAGNSGIAALAARGSAPYREYLTLKKEIC
ncbi:GNAT family N-acetyltransferase [Patescibacteria group bacterium]|nr:GNAT family N-acetyltransferase [Patescibacteria group bacterium]